jgi:hypothetical protein
MIVVDTNGYIHGKDFATAMKLLRSTDADLLKQLRKDMRSDVKSYALMVQEAEPLPDQIPSGFLHPYSATRWESSKAKISLTPGRSRRGPQWQSLLSIKVAPTSKSRGYAIMELAGTRSSGFTPQGKHLVSFLKSRFTNPNPKGGRFFWNKFYSLKPEIVAAGTKSIDRFIDAFNKELR